MVGALFPAGLPYGASAAPAAAFVRRRRAGGSVLTPAVDEPGPAHPHQLERHAAIRAIALWEAGKGLLVLLAGTGVFLLVHRDIQATAERLVTHLHLDPAARYPRIFLKLASEASPGRLRLLALGALVYAVVRLAEAVGLWHDRSWAEWLGVVTGSIYVPFEVAALIRHPGPETLVTLGVNLVVILVLAQRLQQWACVHG
jgi:uncharacterized membrane protein (DUF2068 family)